MANVTLAPPDGDGQLTGRYTELVFTAHVRISCIIDRSIVACYLQGN